VGAAMEGGTSLEDDRSTSLKDVLVLSKVRGLSPHSLTTSHQPPTGWP
jgi:hypothetical protein